MISKKEKRRRKNSRKKKDARGSILLESLLAIVILSVGIAVIVKSMSQSLKALSLASTYTDVFLLADNEMTRLMQSKENIEGPTDSVNFPSPYNQYAFQVSSPENEASVETSDVLNQGIASVRLEILWQNRGKENHFMLDSYLFISDEELED